MEKYLIKRAKTNTGKSVEPHNVPQPLESPPPAIIESLIDADETECLSDEDEIESLFEDDELIRDPGLRKHIDTFHVDARDRIRREYLSRGPCQPYGHRFPRKRYGKDMRAFRDAWFKDFHWLEYSVSNDSAFCLCCYLFKPSNSKCSNDVFVTKGFSNWKKAIERFNEHVGDVNSAHNGARIMLDAFKNQRQDVSRLMVARNLQLEEAYRKRLTAILDVTRLLLRQGLAFRGHDESVSSLNRGNFHEFLKCYCSRNLEFSSVIYENAPRNGQMTSPLIQKQLINACAVSTTNAILEDMGKDRLFSLLVDESRDVSVKEQMAVILRYVNKKGEVIERFLGVVHVDETNAMCLKAAIDNLFSWHGLSLARLRGQGYDGASNMRGELHGLKTLILEENSSAKYVHCFAHQLQLVVVAVARSHGAISDFFCHVTMIVNMCGSSCKRADQFRHLEHDRIMRGLESGVLVSGKGKNQATSLARPGDTRWGSHHSTLLRLQDSWLSVIQVLQNVYDYGHDTKSRGIARSLIRKMKTYEFVFDLHLMETVLGLTNDLSQALQRRDQNIIEAMQLIETVQYRLQALREDEGESLMQEVEMFCRAKNIQVPNMESPVDSELRQKRDGQTVTNLHHFRVEVLYEVIDMLTQEMDDRFPELSTDLLTSFACLDPRNSFSKFDLGKLLHLAELYPEDFSPAECKVLSHQLQNYIHTVRKDSEFSAIQDMQTLSKKMVATGKAEVFPRVYRLIELALLLPVATATVERAFSAMHFVKSYLRSRMSDEWLNDSLVIFIEKGVFAGVSDETILQCFQNMQNRKTLLSPLA